MKKLTNNPPLRRSTILSRRRLEDAADRWWEIYSEALGLFTAHALDESIQNVVILSKENLSDRARQIADMALDAYEERWPEV